MRIRGRPLPCQLGCQVVGIEHAEHVALLDGRALFDDLDDGGLLLECRADLDLVQRGAREAVVVTSAGEGRPVTSLVRTAEPNPRRVSG